MKSGGFREIRRISYGFRTDFTGEIRRISYGFHEIRQISRVKSGGFHMDFMGEIHQISCVKSGGFQG